LIEAFLTSSQYDTVSYQLRLKVSHIKTEKTELVVLVDIDKSAKLQQLIFQLREEANITIKSKKVYSWEHGYHGYSISVTGFDKRPRQIIDLLRERLSKYEYVDLRLPARISINQILNDFS